MRDRTLSGALATIFSIFLGLIVTAFVGVGVYTFHPPPEEDLLRQREALSRQEQDVRDSRPPEQLTAEDRERIGAINDRRNVLNDQIRDVRSAWERSTSIVLIVFATIVMAVSLVRADRLPVISNGLLLGGIFTMLYGVGWIVATDTSVTRFVVMTVALAITLALGYIRFVRQETAPTAAAPRAADDGSVAALQQRVQELEERMRRAASVFGDTSGR